MTRRNEEGWAAQRSAGPHGWHLDTAIAKGMLPGNVATRCS